jgi:hypothetical protein
MDILEALDTIPIVTNCATTDDIASGPILEVNIVDTWVEVDEKTFTALTGFRRKNGEEYHGIVIPLGGNLSSTPPYTGARACLCKTCQSTVESRFQAN